MHVGISIKNPTFVLFQIKKIRWSLTPKGVKYENIGGYDDAKPNVFLEYFLGNFFLF